MSFSRVLVLSFLSPLVLPLLISASDFQRHASGTEERISTYSFPLQFERNVGQAGQNAAFLVHSGRAELVLDSSGAIYWGTAEGSRVKVSATAADARPVILADEEQITRRNYYYPVEGQRQYTDVPSFARVRYRGIYPGVDLIYYGHDGHLEYDYEVAAGADPKAIQLRVEGADSTSLDHGELLIKTGGQELRFSRPVAYQFIRGVRRSITSGYEIRAHGVFFRVGEYDHTSPLVIDPTVIYSTFLNPPGKPSMSAGISADSAGNAYLLAKTDFSFGFQANGLFFTVGPGSCTVSKLSPNGTAILYQTTVAVQGDCGPFTTDASGNAYFSGKGTITPTAGVIQPLNKAHDNFIIKIDPLGHIAYATYFGGSNLDVFSRLATDSLGNLLIAGSTSSNDFPVKNAFQSTLANPQIANGFVSVLNPQASDLVFSTYFSDAAFTDVAEDPAGNVYVVSPSSGPSFPLKNAATSTCAAVNGLCSGLAKFGPSGVLLFSTFSSVATSTNFFQNQGITVDSTGTVYSSGFVGSPGPAAVLTKVDPANGNQQIVVSLAENSGNFFLAGTDSANNVYLGPANESPLIGNPPGNPQPTGVQAPLFSVSPAGVLNFQVNPPSTVVAFAVGPVGTLYVTGAPNVTPFFTVNPLQTAPVVGLTDGTDVFDSYVASLSAAPDASLGTSPGLVNFGDQGLTLSASSVVTLANLGSNSLTISNIAVSGADFSETNTCTAPLASGASCTVTVSFVPSALGTRSGTLTISSNATNALQTVPLVGNAIPTPTPALTFSPTTLTFGSTPVGGFSPAQTVQLTNPGTAAVSFNRVDVSADFQESNNCGTSLAVGASCIVSVIFHPTAAGSRSGSLTITDNVAGSPQTVNLSGTGGSGFVLATPNGTTPSATVSAGQTASYTINLNSVLSFAGQVGFVCSGAPAGASCTVTPSSVQLEANASTPITIAVNTTARSSAAMHPVRLPWLGAAFSAILFTFGMILVGIPRPTLRRNIFSLAVLAGVLLAMAGCGGGSSTPPPPVSGTPAGTYTITLTGTSGSVTQSMALALKVN